MKFHKKDPKIGTASLSAIWRDEAVDDSVFVARDGAAKTLRGGEQPPRLAQRRRLGDPSDRLGTALRVEGVPTAAVFTIDVELWPFERRGPEREKMRTAFKAWCDKADVKIVDEVNQDTVVLYRLQLGRTELDRLLQHRDVRLVDLPPRFQLSDSELMTALAELEPISAPPDAAARLAVLDSGLATNHPLLAPAVGDAQSFIPELGPADESGHGTAIGAPWRHCRVSEPATLRAARLSCCRGES